MSKFRAAVGKHITSINIRLKDRSMKPSTLIFDQSRVRIIESRIADFDGKFTASEAPPTIRCAMVVVDSYIQASILNGNIVVFEAVACMKQTLPFNPV